jgi:hypothetical protein
VQEAERLWPREQQREGGPGGGPGGGLGGEPGGEPGPAQVVSYAEARRRRELAKAEREELATAQAQGSLVHIDYMDQQLAGCLMRVRQVLLSMPGKWAPRLVGVSSVARAQMILQQALDEAMPRLQAIGEDPTLDTHDGAA